MLAQRLVTGSCFILGLIGLLWVDARMGPISIGSFGLPSGLLVALVGCLVVALASVEIMHVAEANGLVTNKPLTAVATVAVMLATWLSGSMPEQIDAALPLTIIAMSLVASLLIFIRGRKVEIAFASTAVVMLAVVYLGVLSGFLLLIGSDFSVWMIGGVALVVKSCDMGAYFTGRAIGKHKLIPWLSPGKTVEGLAGGIVASMAAALILDSMLGFPLAWWWAARDGSGSGSDRSGWRPDHEPLQTRGRPQGLLFTAPGARRRHGCRRFIAADGTTGMVDASVVLVRIGLNAPRRELIVSIRN